MAITASRDGGKIDRGIFANEQLLWAAAGFDTD